MYNYLIIFCFTLFYTSVFYPRKFDSGMRRFFDRSRTAVPASFDAVSPLPVPGVQAAHYVGDLFPGIAAVVGRFGSGRRSAVLDVLLHPGGHLPDPARVFRIVYLVDLLFGIVDHVVELQRGCPSILYSSPEPFPALNISLYCGVR